MNYQGTFFLQFNTLQKAQHQSNRIEIGSSFGVKTFPFPKK
jgi:hypothetical protein